MAPTRGWRLSPASIRAWTRCPSACARWRSSRGDLAGELRAYGEEPELGGGAGQALTLDGVEERLAEVERLMRKHGGSIAGVLEHAARARERRDELAGAEVALESTRERLREAEATLQEHVQALRGAREAAAPALERGVCEQLASLAMPDASFEVALSAARPARPAATRSSS